MLHESTNMNVENKRGKRTKKGCVRHLHHRVRVFSHTGKIHRCGFAALTRARSERLLARSMEAKRGLRGLVVKTSQAGNITCEANMSPGSSKGVSYVYIAGIQGRVHDQLPFSKTWRLCAYPVHAQAAPSNSSRLLSIRTIYLPVVSYLYIYIRLSGKFFSFHKVIIDEQEFLFYISLLN